MKSFLNGFTRGEVNKNVVLLSYGKHHCKIVKAWETDSRHRSSSDSDLKTDNELGEWIDPTPQVAVMFQGIDPDTEKPTGVIIRRFNLKGYTRFEELDDELVKSCFQSGTESYAVHEVTHTRIASEERTMQAINIFNEFLDACGIPIGYTFEGDDPLEVLIGKEINIVVDRKTYDGRNIPVVTKVEAVKEEITDTEEVL